MDKNSPVQIRNEKYHQYVSKITPRSSWFPSLLWAFLIGGLICIIGELLGMFFTEIFPEYDKGSVGSLVSGTLILVAAILTGFGVYDKLGSFAGGGSVVPITGFSNSMTSAAIEFRKEGIVFGTCSNMFRVAGPVIVIGVALSMLVGAIYWVGGLLGIL
jgi:stage V sporulation protein AC